MTSRTTLIIASIFGMLAVMLGAFGAHGLRDMLTATGRLETFNLAVEYQFYHALALLGVGILSDRIISKKLSLAATCFAVGVIFFSGSLYILALLDKPVMGAITPIGGVAFILGWLFLLLAVIEKKKALP